MALEMAQSIAAAPGNSAKKNAKSFRSCCPNATITQAIFPGSPHALLVLVHLCARAKDGNIYVAAGVPTEPNSCASPGFS